MTAIDTEAETDAETRRRALTETQHEALQKFLATLLEDANPPPVLGPLPQPRATLLQKARPPPQAQPIAGDLELLTAREVQTLLRISSTTLWRMGRKRKGRNGVVRPSVLRPIRTSERRVAYAADEVRKLIAERMAARTDAAAPALAARANTA